MDADEQLDGPPLHIAETVLANLAPELVRHVVAFLHGHDAPMPVASAEVDYAAPSIKLRNLHDALTEALLRKSDPHKVAILSAAVCVQAGVLYNNIQEFYGR